MEFIDKKWIMFKVNGMIGLGRTLLGSTVKSYMNENNKTDIPDIPDNDEIIFGITLIGQSVVIGFNDNERLTKIKYVDDDVFEPDDETIDSFIHSDEMKEYYNSFCDSDTYFFRNKKDSILN